MHALFDKRAHRRLLGLLADKRLNLVERNLRVEYRRGLMAIAVIFLGKPVERFFILTGVGAPSSMQRAMIARQPVDMAGPIGFHMSSQAAKYLGQALIAQRQPRQPAAELVLQAAKPRDHIGGQRALNFVGKLGPFLELL